MQEVRTFRCRDLGLACEFEEKAESENELMKRVEGHLQIDPGQPEVQERVCQAMR